MDDTASPRDDADLVGAVPAEVARRPLHDAGWVAAAMGVANALGYALNLVASRALGPTGFGALGALLGVVLIGNVVALALQAVTSRVLAAHPADPAAEGARLYRLAARSALAVGLTTTAAAPLLAWLLHLPEPTAAWLLPLVLAPLTLTGVQLGLLQGAERFRAVGALYVVVAVGKVGGGLVGLAVTDSVVGTVLGTAVGTTVSAGVGHLLVGGAGPARGAGPQLRSHRAEVLWATHALLVLFALTNVDVLLARHYLSGPEAGLYAVGAVVAKGAFWLPGFVVVVALPALSDEVRRRRAAVLSITAVGACGAVVTAACAVRGDLVVAAVGGASYASLAPDVWLFAAAGSLFALAQLLVYSRLAATDRRAVAAVWAALLLLLAVVVAGGRHGTTTEIVGALLVAAAALVGVGAAAELAEHRAGSARRHGDSAGRDAV